MSTGPIHERVKHIDYEFCRWIKVLRDWIDLFYSFGWSAAILTEIVVLRVAC